jgi:hypothetical protein
MTDERVDELLRDLDDALSVQPSPSVAARVRTRVAVPAHRLAGWRRLTLATAMVVVIGASYLVWRPDDAAPERAPTQGASRLDPSAAPIASSQPVPPVQSPAGHTTPVDRATSAVRGTSVDRGGRLQADPDGVQALIPTRATRPAEPEVIVSPEIRLALQQLADSARMGRLPAQLPAGAEPVVITPSVVEVSVLEIDVVPMAPPPAATGADGAREPDGESTPIWPNGPFPRTRRTS